MHVQYPLPVYYSQVLLNSCKTFPLQALMVLVLFLGQLYRIVPKTSVHGGMKRNDGGRATAWSCRQACDVMETCVAFDYNFPHKDCFLHTAETNNGKAEINGEVDHFFRTGELWNICTIGKSQLLIIANSLMKNHIRFFCNCRANFDSHVWAGTHWTV